MKTNIKALQTEMLEIMKIVDKICTENNISYMLAWGTALGAVRHKGFIPWDDDADISMLYGDYLKFIEICKKKDVLPDGYILQTYETDKKYPFLFAKIRNINTELREKAFDGLGIQEGIWIDIFPALNVSNKNFVRAIQKKALAVGNWICHKYYFLNDNRFVREHHSHLRAKRLILRCMPDALIQKSIELIMKTISSEKGGRSKYVASVDISSDFYIMPKKIYLKCCYMQFEDTKLMVSEHYDEYLTLAYGDYMTPVKYGHDLIEE